MFSISELCGWLLCCRSLPFIISKWNRVLATCSVTEYVIEEQAWIEMPDPLTQTLIRANNIMFQCSKNILQYNSDKKTIYLKQSVPRFHSKSCRVVCYNLSLAPIHQFYLTCGSWISTRNLKFESPCIYTNYYH